MTSIHDEAWSGRLTADSLNHYISNSGRAIIDSVGRIENVTPLAAACWKGHLDVVRLLLDKRAKPDAPSEYSRTPLFYATSRSEASSRDRVLIVRALLDAGADVDKCCGLDDKDYTPLMLAIAELKDKDVVHELVDRGARLTAKAQSLAKLQGMERDLRTKAERSSSRAANIEFLIEVVLTIIAFVNHFFNNIVKKLYGISGKRDKTVEKDLEELGDPRTAEGFKTSLNEYITESGLNRFFAPDDPFLQTLAEKASALRNDPKSSLGTPENIKRLTRVSLYQLVIYCDDSGSMSHANRWQNQRELVARIAAIATKLIPDNFGVELRFINSPSSSNLSAAEIDSEVAKISPDGGTRIGTSLRKKILDPLIYNVIANPNMTLARPLLVCTLTDGCPNDKQPLQFKQEIVDCRLRLVNAGYTPSAAMFMISQIGDDDDARKFLDELRNDEEIDDVLYCTTDRLDSEYQELRQNEDRMEAWLLQTLTRPIMERNLE